MVSSPNPGWMHFASGFPWFKGEDKFPIQAYSEFMPALRTGINPYTGEPYPWVFSEDDPFGWKIPEIEDEFQLKPGLESIAMEIMAHLVQLGHGVLQARIAGHQNRNIINNLFWPKELQDAEGKLGHERYVALTPLSLSKTKDDKGRVRWTLFGGSEQGPEKAFWKSFYTAPGKEVPAERFISTMQWIFSEAYGLNPETTGNLYNCGFRILPTGDHFPFPYWKQEQLPSWTKQYLVGDDDDFDGVKYLLTFRPFGALPAKVRERYLSGRLNLLPFPGSMIVWGVRNFLHLQEKLFNAIQMPLLKLVNRNEDSTGIRVPQSGWAHQPGVSGKKAEILEELIVNAYIRTSRWDRFHRNDDALLSSKEIDPVMQTLFSTNLEALDLYNKPMARNSQLFSDSIELLLDGPEASRVEIGKAALKVIDGGLFLYRFYFPPMQVGEYEVFWQRPVISCLSVRDNKPVCNTNMPTGYFTAYKVDKRDLEHPVELWPRIQDDQFKRMVLTSFNPEFDHYHNQTPLNIYSIMVAWDVFGKRSLPRDFARRLIRIPKEATLEDWFATFPKRSFLTENGEKIAAGIEKMIEPADIPSHIPSSYTFRHTATREYEEAYWNQIHFLAHGKYVNKDNADVVTDPVTKKLVDHPGRDLHELGNYLLSEYAKKIAAAGMEGLAEAGELPFQWKTDFEFYHFGGWKANQEGSEYERNILVIIPGKNRNEAVVMADHYDTAYMEDVYDTSAGGSGARLSAAGADDNHSATSTLLLAAPIYLEMARQGKLERDIWLLHLTGEEFPSDCMGARNFCQNLVQGTLRMKKPDGSARDLSHVKIAGVYVMDMIAHNRNSARDIFQIAPGKNYPSLRLALEAHIATREWNAGVEAWNMMPDRAGCERGHRVKEGDPMPGKALFLKLDGDVRTWDDPHSTLYNTDGIIFSDTGVPVVLFMENYDIHRTGYHDTHDTMENIDLDYGSAVSAIAIETVARMAVYLEG